MANRAIGEILKRRIKEMGYSQEKFADVANIKYDSLRNYLDGTSIYSIDHLIKFSKLLDCSYEYLLGDSNATKNENHILVNELGLSNKAIESIREWRNNDNPDLSENLLQTLDKIICKDGLLFYLSLYILVNKKFVDLSEKLFDDLVSESLPHIGLEPSKTMYLSVIVALLTELRDESKGEIVISEEAQELIENKCYNNITVNDKGQNL